MLTAVSFTYFHQKKDRCTTSYVLEVFPEIRNCLRTHNRIYLGFSACRFADRVHVLQCYRSLAFSHRAVDCAESPVYRHCMGEYEVRTCEERKRFPKCDNCSH